MSTTEVITVGASFLAGIGVVTIIQWVVTKSRK